MKFYAGANPGMHHEVSSEIDHERQRGKEGDVGLFLSLEFLVRLFLCGFEFNVFAKPFAAQGQIMITDYRAKPRIGHENLKHFLVLWSLGNKISDADHLIFL